MDDTAATLQTSYDQAVYEFGVDSQQAKDAELEAQQFFKKVSTPPVTAAFQTKENHAIFS